jgi:voltage-gated potassium channel
MPILAFLMRFWEKTPLPRRRRRHALRNIALALLVLLLLHIALIHWLENLDWWTATWLTFITVSTVGYGDVSAKTVPGQMVTLGLLVIPGIALFSKLLGEAIQQTSIRKHRQFLGQWRWHMKDHILVINPPKNVEAYMRIVVDEFLKYPEYEHCAFQVVSTNFHNGLPVGLQDMNVLLYSSSANSESTLKAIKAELAKVIIVLAPDPDNEDADACTFDLIHRIRDVGSKAYIVAEVISDQNRRRIKLAGANATMRPIRAYPEIAVRAVLAPGSENVIEELFDSAGSEYRTVMTPPVTMRWSDIMNLCVANDFGTPLAWIRDDDEIIINPFGSSMANFKGLILAVSDQATWTNQQLVAMLTQSDN